MSPIIKENNLNFSLQRIIILTIVLYLFRPAIPLIKIPFLFFYLCIVIIIVGKHYRILIKQLLKFCRDYSLIFILLVFLIIAFLFSNKIYLLIFKEIINSLILVSLFFLLSLIIESVSDLKRILNYLIWDFVIVALVVSIIYIFDNFEIISFFQDEFAYSNFVGSENVVFVDYNFAIIPCFFAIIISLMYWTKEESKLKAFAFIILLYVFSLNIFLSGSRRGIFVYLLMLSCAFLLITFLIIKKDIYFNKLRNFLLFFIGFSCFNVIGFYYFFFIFSPSQQNSFLELIGSKNLSVAKYKTSYKLYRYYSIFNKEQDFSELFWRNCVDPKDPDSGWGYRVHKTIYPLSGENVDILPSNVKGYLIDNTSNSNFYAESNLSESYTMFVAIKAKDGDQYCASVYCFVSEDFSGNSVSFGNSAANIDAGLVCGNPVSSYDLSQKGKWQMLNVKFNSKQAYIPLLMSIIVQGENFSKLAGHVIFAYPQYMKILESADFIYDANLNEVDSISEKSILYELNNDKSKEKYRRFYTSSILSISTSKSLSFQDDSDPIRRWTSLIISEDTTYFGYKSNIILDTISNAFIADRIQRWKFALEIFSKEFSWNQKIFGGGFNFLNWYGKFFLNDKTQSDYPHNPFLHILLYSGIVGLLFYLFFIYKIFYFYIKYIQEYSLLFIFFLITMFFTFFSSGDPFDPPLMGFFSILPFFIHSVHKRSLKESSGTDRK